MTISYRQLIKWRKEALRIKFINAFEKEETSETEMVRRILALTQELIDQCLIRRKS